MTPPTAAASHGLDAWDYVLPPDRIAQFPTQQRSVSRLMRVPLSGRDPVDLLFRDLPGQLEPGDLLVANDTRVMAARLRARRATGGAVELLLLEPGPGPVRAMARPARKLRIGEILALDAGGTATIVEPSRDGVVRVELDQPPAQVMEAQGEMPIPPYLGRGPQPIDAVRYQTVYAGPLGAAAAPTAGLHFTRDVIDELGRAGVGFAKLTLHVGIGTFRPLQPDDFDKTTLHAESYEIPAATAAAVAETRAAGGRVVAVGTTTARALESATASGSTAPTPGPAQTELFIRPPYRFRSLDGLITNFHLPRSSLLMLVGALVGRERLLEAYQTAIARGYRFYSYGDAMLLL